MAPPTPTRSSDPTRPEELNMLPPYAPSCIPLDATHACRSNQREQAPSNMATTSSAKPSKRRATDDNTVDPSKRAKKLPSKQDHEDKDDDEDMASPSSSASPMMVPASQEVDDDMGSLPDDNDDDDDDVATLMSPTSPNAAARSLPKDEDTDEGDDDDVASPVVAASLLFSSPPQNEDDMATSPLPSLHSPTLAPALAPAMVRGLFPIRLNNRALGSPRLGFNARRPRYRTRADERRAVVYSSQPHVAAGSGHERHGQQRAPAARPGPFFVHGVCDAVRALSDCGQTLGARPVLAWIRRGHGQWTPRARRRQQWRGAVSQRQSTVARWLASSFHQRQTTSATSD